MFKRWGRENGYRDVLRIGLPLVVSMGTTSIIHFTDRMFLSNYSVEAIAASAPASIASFLFLSFFMGVASYANVFVAQYTGAGAPHRVGASLWQGIYFSLGAAIFLGSLVFVAESLFRFGGHPAEIRKLEVIYFRVLTLGAGAVVLSTALSCFYTGRGKNRPVMVVNLLGAAINIPLDYVLINGIGVFPELGIAGAGIATVSAQVCMVILFAALVFRSSNNSRYKVWAARAFDRELFKRLMRYGLPGGAQFFIDIFAVTFFIFMIGRLGKVELAVSNIVFAINHLAFMPMVGFSIGVSAMVGQAIGKGRPEEALEATTSTFHITFTYMTFVALVFVLAPEALLSLFRSNDYSAQEYGQIMKLGVELLRFVALYTLFDSMLIIYFGALRGAGDIYFVMRAMALIASMVMIPVYIGVEYLNFGIYATWVFLTLYVVVLALVLRWRYRAKKWMSMRVIESPPPVRNALPQESA